MLCCFGAFRARCWLFELILDCYHKCDKQTTSLYVQKYWTNLHVQKHVIVVNHQLRPCVFIHILIGYDTFAFFLSLLKSGKVGQGHKRVMSRPAAKGVIISQLLWIKAHLDVGDGRHFSHFFFLLDSDNTGVLYVKNGSASPLSCKTGRHLVINGVNLMSFLLLFYMLTDSITGLPKSTKT